ncbi:hypothetical protein Poli38472_004001 [Pythium oligandrum]|uniref:Exportin-4 n=1 Tax=Pythium oligandrum TaxID=41045 RepID=A0A8K1CP83_PYTOL|nr:hypothetical protein Poli38472_004001 [Pythium oligandrum]|eukprot:TMW66236.1 hypothetical protein Poli38472_004001 [Pythium oligandrum]
MSALATLEAACLALHAPPTDEEAKRKRLEAEAVLEHFKRSPSALQDAVSLIVPTTPAVVQFHCIATIREVTLKKWPLLTPQERSQPMDLMMQFLWEHYASLPPFVSGSLLQTIVLMMKRGWLERSNDERQAVIQQMGQMMSGAGDAQQATIVRRLIAAKWILAFVTEFSSASRSSAMFQPIEFHTSCRKTLRKGGLKDLVGFGIQLLEDLIQTTTMCSTQDGHELNVPREQLELLETAFLLVVEMLNWDFTDSMGNLAWSLTATDAGTEESRPTIVPDDSWRATLIRPELIHSAFNTYAFFRNLKTKNENLLHLARQFLIQLASLRGPIFKNKAEQVQFLQEVFRGTSGIIHHPFLDMVAANDYASYDIATREMIDMCQLLFRLINNLGLEAFIKQAPPQLFSSFLEELSSLSCKLLQSALEKIRAHLQQQTDGTVDDLWQLEAVDVLLDAWVALITDPFLDSGRLPNEPLSPELQAVSSALSQFSAPVVDLYLQTQFELCSVNALADQDEEEDVEDNSAAGTREQYEMAASLARMNASSSASLLLKLLQSLVSDIQQNLAGLQGRNEITPVLSQLYEKLHFTVEFTGLFLADDYTSEQPGIPSRIHETFFHQTGSTGGSDVINLLLYVLSQILEFDASRVAQNPLSETLSPFVSEQLILTITRLCATYLGPEVVVSDVAPALSQVFGLQEGSQAGALATFLVQQCSMYLIHWPTQPVVMENLMQFLLKLSSNKVIAHVVQAPFWQSLVQANAAAGTFLTAQAAGEQLLSAVARIPSALRGQLVEALCRAGMSCPDEAMQRGHFDAIASPLTQRLQNLIATPNFGSSESANDVRVQEELKLVVELYSGVARSTEAKSHSMISSFALPALPVMVKLFDLFHGDAQIVYLILRFYCLLVEAQISYLSPKDALQVYTSSHELIRSYARHNLGKKSVFADAEEDSYTDLLALLQLLSHLVSKEFIDYSDASADQTDVEHVTGVVVDVVFAGLSQVIPLMTEQLLQYPSLSKQYFTLISYMIDVHAERLAHLDERLFGMLLHSLLFGIRHVQIEVARYSFQAIGELAGFHWKALEKGEPGLSRHKQAEPDVFVHFVRVILRMALFEDFNPVILDSCAGALYPLILIERDRYFAIADELRAEQPDTIVQQRLLTAFQALISFLKPEDIAMGNASTRKYRLLFKSHLFQFVADVRGFIQVK